MDKILERANRIHAAGIFLGGKVEHFEAAGRKLIITLLSEGLTPASKVLDIGCGCLRGGYWLIHFLDKDCYFGLEPNTQMLDAGIGILLEPGLTELKQPRFDRNSDFDFKVFNQRFDFMVALSIWTHASKPQIQVMLDGFTSTTNANGVFITSYYPATILKPDYKGEKPLGTSFGAATRGFVHHSFNWIQAECARRGLEAQEIKEKAFKYWDQTWIRIKHMGF
jgi:cyclopropane fatty-acyl-phospholipid synthase-like methyltransferase